MTFYLIGIDYRKSSLYARESAYRLRLEIEKAGPHQVALFTCNRTEVYGLADDEDSARDLIESLKRTFPEVFADAYIKLGKLSVFPHALSLACGLKSQLIGEREITKQLRVWIARDDFPFLLREFWQGILVASDRIRLQSGLAENASDVAEVILKDIITQGQSKKKELVVIGTGKLAQLFAHNSGEEINLYFASRKRHSRARKLAQIAQAKVILLDKLTEVLSFADIVVVASGSPHYLLKTAHLEERKDKPLYIYDLSVPRNVAPCVGNIKEVVLKTLDDLDPLFKEHNQVLTGYIQKAKYLIEQEKHNFKEKIRVSNY